MRQQQCFGMINLLLGALLAVAASGLVAADGGSEPKEPARKDLAGDPLPHGALARMGTLHWRHGATITFVAFLPDGKAVITAGEDNTIRLWDRETGKEIRRFSKQPVDSSKGSGDPDKPEEAVRRGMMWLNQRGMGSPNMALSPDGKTLAATMDNIVQLWDVATGKGIRQIKSAPNGVSMLAFSADSKTLAGRGQDATTYLWETATGKEIRKFQGAVNNDPRRVFIIHDGGSSSCLAISPDGKTLAWTETEQNKAELKSLIKLVESESGKEIRRIRLDQAGASSITYSPDGKTLAYASGDKIHLCEADTNKEINVLKGHTGSVGLVSFAPDGKTLVSRGIGDRTLRLWDAATGEQIRQLGEPTPAPRGGGAVFFLDFGGTAAERDFAFSPEGKVVAVGGGNSVRFISTETGKEMAGESGHRGPITAVVLCTDGKTMVSRGSDNTIYRWEAATGKELSHFRGPAGTTCVAIAPDGRTIALGNQDNTIRIHETSMGKELHKLTGPATGVVVIAFSPNGKTLAARGNRESIKLYDAETGKDLKTIAVAAETNPSPDGVLLFTAGGTGGSASNLVFSPDGTTLASLAVSNAAVRAPGAVGGPTTNIELFDVSTGKVRKIGVPEQRAVRSMAFSPDGRILATENGDQTVTLWEVASGKERAHLGKLGTGPKPGDRMMAGVFIVGGPFAGGAAAAAAPGLAFAPDGRMLASRIGNEVRLWDINASKELKRFKGHQGEVVTVAFGADGKTMATGSDDTTILVWDASTLSAAKPPKVELTAKEVETLWSDLATLDAGKAFKSMQQMLGDPKHVAAFLKEQLKPVAPVEQKVLDKYIAELDSDDFAERTKANEELEKIGELAVPALTKVLAGKPSLEMSKRVEELLDKAWGGFVTEDHVRLVRALEVLEKLNTGEARAVLETLAKGAPGALPTREAQAALKRMLKNE